MPKRDPSKVQKKAAQAKRYLETHPDAPAHRRLKNLRLAMELTQTALGAALDGSGPGVSVWERGKVKPADGSPYLIEQWSRGAVEKLGLPASVAIGARDWLAPKVRERLDASPSSAAQSPEAA